MQCKIALCGRRSCNTLAREFRFRLPPFPPTPHRLPLCEVLRPVVRPLQGHGPDLGAAGHHVRALRRRQDRKGGRRFLLLARTLKISRRMNSKTMKRTNRTGSSRVQASVSGAQQGESRFHPRLKTDTRLRLLRRKKKKRRFGSGPF